MLCEFTLIGSTLFFCDPCSCGYAGVDDGADSDRRSSAGNERKRQRFGSKLEGILYCIGSAVGLGDVWRFPFLAYQNGGGELIVQKKCSWERFCSANANMITVIYSNLAPIRHHTKVCRRTMLDVLALSGCNSWRIIKNKYYNVAKWVNFMKYELLRKLS